VTSNQSSIMGKDSHSKTLEPRWQPVERRDSPKERSKGG
jgi:hypothetical protein